MHARDVTAAVLAAGFFQAMLTFGIGIITPGYHLIHDYISASSATDAPYQAWGYYFGMAGAALHLVFVRAMWDAYVGWLWGRISAACFAGFFWFIAVSALFQCDPGCAVETTEALVHTILGFVAFTFLGLAALSLCIGLVIQHAPGRRSIIATGIAVIIADLALLVGHLMGIWPGLVERATIVAMWAWTFALWRASRISAPARPTPPATAGR